MAEDALVFSGIVEEAGSVIARDDGLLTVADIDRDLFR